MTRAELVRLCHALHDESAAIGLDAFVWGSFTDRRAVMLDLPRFADPESTDLTVLVAPDAPVGRMSNVHFVSVPADEPAVPAWEFGVAGPGFAGLIRATAQGAPPTSRDDPDRRVDVSVLRDGKARRELVQRLLSVQDRLTEPVVREGYRRIRLG